MRTAVLRRKASMRPVVILVSAVAAALLAAGVLAFGAPRGAVPADRGGVLYAVGAENQYANIIKQVGGRYVRVSALLSNPNTDPHTFAASSAVTREVADAAIVVQNGLGYDTFMNTIEAATPGSGRTVINVRRLLNQPDSTRNPHLWYDPATMPRVASAIASALAAYQPEHAAYFRANAAAFAKSLKPLRAALAGFRAAHPRTPVAVTEPIANYLLRAAGAVNLTPWSFQADIMNGVDPSPQAVAAQRELISGRKVAALVYNVQVTDPLTKSLITLASQHHVPVVGVYETMPEPGYDYQSWMLAETAALRQAVGQHVSSEHL